MANVQQLNTVAQRAIEQAKNAKSPAEAQKYQAIARQAIDAINAQKSVVRPGESIVDKVLNAPGRRVSQLMETKPGDLTSVAGVRQTLQTGMMDVLGGAIKGVGGIVSLPYELPALVAAGAESAAQKLGYEDADFTPDWLQQGKGYEFVTGQWGKREAKTQFGIALENLGEAGAESLPALAAGPVVYGYAVTAELARKQAADSIRPFSGTTAMVLEAVPLAGPEVAAITTTAGRPATSELLRAQTQQDRAKVAKKLREAQLDELGGASTGKGQAAMKAVEEAEGYGFTLSRGQATEDTAQLALENQLKNSPEGGVLVDLDISNANKVPEFFIKAYDLVETKAITGKALEDALTAEYDTFIKTRQNQFKAATRQKFDKLDELDVRFDMSPILSKIEELKTKYVLDEQTITPDPISKALDRLADSLTGTKQVEQVRMRRRGDRPGMERTTEKVRMSTGTRSITPKELQKHLQDIGEMSFTGSHRTFGDINPGTTRAIGRELGGAMKQILEESASGGDIAAIQLKEARDFYAKSLKDMKTWAKIPFIKFMDKDIEALDGQTIIDTVKAVGEKEIPIVKALLQKDKPELIPQIRKSLLEDVIKQSSVAGREVGERIVDTKVYMDNMQKLMKDNQFFKDVSANVIRDMRDFVPTVNKLMKNSAVKGISSRPEMINELARINSDLQGVALGTQGRYTAMVAERVAEVTVKALKDPRQMAQNATNPRMAKILKKAIKQTPLTREEAIKFDAWAAAYRLQLLDDIREEADRE